jgi:two-component system, LuxR family, response regulator FixJ
MLMRNLSIIQLVDDDDAVRDSMRLLLESCGLKARGYASAGEFLEDGRTEGGCLLLDVHMPGMNGIELLERIRRSGSTLPVIVITGRGDPALKERAIKAGALAFLEKPVDDSLLIAELDRALASGAA